MWILDVLKMLIVTICFVPFVIVLLAVYAIMMLISIPCMIIIFPFALIKAEIELKAQKNKLNKEEKENI